MSLIIELLFQNYLSHFSRIEDIANYINDYCEIEFVSEKLKCHNNYNIDTLATYLHVTSAMANNVVPKKP